MTRRLIALAAAFILGLVLYLVLGETGWITWHRGEGPRPALAGAAQGAPAAPPAGAGTAARRKVFVLNSFEGRSECLVGVDGYSLVERSTQKVSDGDHSLRAEFLLRAQFYSTPTPQATPYQPPLTGTPTATPTATPPWRPRVLVGMGAATALRTQDFSNYRSLKLDVFNPEERPINGMLEIGDSRGYVFVLPAVGLEGQKVTTLGADLPDLAAQDLDLTRIRHVAFHVDVAGRGSAPVLYLDYLRLEP
jgi:hypothetical protein